MLVTALALLLGASVSTPTSSVVVVTPTPTAAPFDGPRLSLECVVDGAAQAVAASTTPTSALALRFGGVNNAGAGPYWGLDASVIVTNQSAGTVDVAVTRLAGLVEARGLYGARFRRGFMGVGGYGFAGAGGGIGSTSAVVFDDVATRLTPSWRLRAGIGAEVDVGPLLLRIETGGGAATRAPEVFGAVGFGFRW